MFHPGRLFVNGNAFSGQSSLVYALCGEYIGEIVHRSTQSRGPQVSILSVDGSRFSHYSKDNDGLPVEVWSCGGRYGFFEGITTFADPDGVFVVVLHGLHECYTSYVDYWTQFSVMWGAKPENVLYVVTHADKESFSYEKWGTLIPDRLYCVSSCGDSTRLQELRQCIGHQLMVNRKLPPYDQIMYDIQMVQNYGDNIMPISLATECIGRSESEMKHSLGFSNTALVCADVVITNRAWLMRILMLLTQFGSESNSGSMENVRKWNHLHEADYMNLMVRDYGWFIHGYEYWSQSIGTEGKCVLCTLKPNEKLIYEHTTFGACKYSLKDHCFDRKTISLLVDGSSLRDAAYHVLGSLTYPFHNMVDKLSGDLWNVLVELKLAFPLTSPDGKKLYYLHDVRPDIGTVDIPTQDFSLLEIPVTNRHGSVREMLSIIFRCSVIATGNEIFTRNRGLWQMRLYVQSEDTTYTVLFFEQEAHRALYVSPPCDVELLLKLR